MVKFFESNFGYDYSFPAVTLAYFLRYPNYYSKHVLSSDVIDRHFDPVTQRLHTTRLHLKRSKVPTAVLKLLPKTVLGTTSNASGQSYILETSVVDVKAGWMRTEAKNLEWTGILSVIERQLYTRPTAGSPSRDAADELEGSPDGRWTDVNTVVVFQSRLGQGRLRGTSRPTGESASGSSAESDMDEEPAPKRGFFSRWSTSSIQRSIELIGVRRTGDHVSKSTEGMKLVLERLRKGGLVGVLEGMRRDRETAVGPAGPWKSAWRSASDRSASASASLDQVFDDE
ncbi:MAG: hypothetical protein M1838_002194 [Thelocarpon superellum]|nr:MAG: hypothetical protein M1838_002194 [Thelocarpon superellum]